MANEFYALMGRMRYITRWGLMRNTQAENDMEHAFQTAMIAHAIALLGNARYRRDYDAEHIMALAMYHDASEVITGDLPTPVKHNNPVIRDEYHRLEAIAAYIKCLEERKMGKRVFAEAETSTLSAIRRIDLPEVQDFMDDFVPGFGMSLDEISRD